MLKERYEILIDALEKGGYLKTPEIKEAFRAIDREDFVPEEYKASAYENTPLPIGFGQTISQPLVVAFMLELLAPQPGEKVLEIGSGSGWQTGLLAHLVGKHIRETGGIKETKGRGRKKAQKPAHVISTERIPELSAMAEANLQKYGVIGKNIVELCTADGAKGWESQAPYDKIIAGAASQGDIPEAWKAQLKIGGRIVAPVEQSIVMLDKKSSTEFEKKEYFGFTFVPLIQEQ